MSLNTCRTDIVDTLCSQWIIAEGIASEKYVGIYLVQRLCCFNRMSCEKKAKSTAGQGGSGLCSSAVHVVWM